MRLFIKGYAKKFELYWGVTFKAGRNTITLEVFKRSLPALCDEYIRSGLGCHSGPWLGS